VAYADLYAYNGDPDFVSVPLSTLLSKSYAATLCGKVDPTKASHPTAPGNIPAIPVCQLAVGQVAVCHLGIEGDTIYGTTADRWGTWRRGSTATTAASARGSRFPDTGSYSVTACSSSS